jgi:hypothetical protein
MRHRATPDEAYKQDLTYLFEVYALWPDERRTLEYLYRMNRQPHADAFLAGQIHAALSSDTQWPRFDPSDEIESGWSPPFLFCFPGIFAPARGHHACWRPVTP